VWESSRCGKGCRPQHCSRVGRWPAKHSGVHRLLFRVWHPSLLVRLSHSPFVSWNSDAPRLAVSTHPGCFSVSATVVRTPWAWALPHRLLLLFDLPAAALLLPYPPTSRRNRSHIASTPRVMNERTNAASRFHRFGRWPAMGRVDGVRACHVARPCPSFVTVPWVVSGGERQTARPATQTKVSV
jgi:hypothetical protein